MSEFHYVRTLGVEGGVDAVEGPAIGMDLDTLLKAGVPPFKAALEVVAALCEILDIADEDGEVHGDIRLRSVFVDETGAISLEGFGVERRTSPAPEGAPRGSATDLYGLGLVTMRLLGGQEPTAVIDDPDAHDDAIIDAVIATDLAALPEEIIGDVQWYLAKLMTFDREDRPSALDTWRTFIAFADAVDGVALSAWAASAIAGKPPTRTVSQAPMAPPTDAPDADALDGPVMKKGPLAKGGLSFDAGSGKPGQATAFWSKDQMKAALDREEEEEDSYRPAVGGGAATSFWSREEMAAMAEGRADAPRPKRVSVGSERSVAYARARGDGPLRSTSFDRPETPAPAPPPQPPPPPAPKPQPVAEAPRQAPPPIAGPVASPTQDEEEEEGGSGLLIALVVVVLLVIVCAGVLTIGGVGAVLFADSSTDVATTPATAPDSPPPTPAEAEDTEPPEAAPPEAPPEAPKPSTSSSAAKPTTSSSSSSTTSKPSTSTSSSSSKTSSSASKPKAAPKPAPEPPSSGPITVFFKADQRGNLRCTDGQAPKFDGPLTLTFQPYALPVTCAIITDGGATGYFQTSVGKSYTCTTAGSDIKCTGT